MCGIAGILGTNASALELKRLLDPIAHRGEEKYRYETLSTSTFALGMHRLGIVDEASGKQPFLSQDKQVALVFNGEIYNQQDIRRDLSRTYGFYSGSDGEAVLNAYLEWGLDFVNHLDGKFAIAIYDGRKKSLILARDPMGVKPLYYAHKNGKVYFSSEVKSLSQNLDTEIFEISPGSVWVNSQQSNYFLLGNFKIEDTSNEEILEKQSGLRNVLSQAVKKRIKEGDAKIACLLSGGVDSAIITYLAAQNHPNVIAYTLAESNKNSDDLKAAAMLSDFLKIKHVVVSPSIEEMSNFYLKYGVYMTESYEPVLVRNAVAYHFVCKKVAQDGFKYCLNGEGADELFGGYDFVKEAPEGKQDDLIRYSLSIIHNSYLKMADRASMFTTLEARVPYMDKAVVKTALDLPPKARLTKDMNKVILRDAFKGQIPEEIIYRRKVGMNEGAGFGVNLPDQSIYYNCVKNYYKNNVDHYEKDLALCVTNDRSRNLNLSQIEEVYNFARFVELGFNKLKGHENRLQLNTQLRGELVAQKLMT